MREHRRRERQRQRASRQQYKNWHESGPKVVDHPLYTAVLRSQINAEGIRGAYYHLDQTYERFTQNMYYLAEYDAEAYQMVCDGLKRLRDAAMVQIEGLEQQQRAFTRHLQNALHNYESLLKVASRQRKANS